MKIFGSWFSGFGGVDIGAKDAGYQLIFAFEHDRNIARVYRKNLGKHVIAGDILLSDSGIYHDDCPRTQNQKKRRRQDITGEWWTRTVKRGARIDEFKFSNPQFPTVTNKHDSPPCPVFSPANRKGIEGLREIALARKCCEYLMYARPDYYSLENVYPYRNSQSFQIILETLEGLGYSYDYWHINMADYGVPQIRKRLILFARKDGKKPVKPMPTHYNPNGKKSESGFVGSLFLKPWNNWYDEIEDLIPGLPDSKFADWQLKRLPDELKTFLITQDYKDSNKVKNRSVQIREYYEPAATVKASDSNSLYLRAFVVEGANTSHDKIWRLDSEPVQNLTASDHKNPRRVVLKGRVVQITPRCLARWQTFPNWYRLPKNKKLACRGIGNAVPPLFMKILYEQLCP